MDLLWAGLVRRLGPEAVVGFPDQERHHAGVPRPTGDIREDYGAERRSLCYTGRESELLHLGAHTVTSMLVGGGIDRVFVDERDESFAIWKALQGPASSAKVVVVAGHDRFWNGSPEHVAAMYGRNFEMMFIDDWQPEYDALPWTRLINLSTNYDHLWDVSKRHQLLSRKKFDVCFIGYVSSPSRKAVVDHIKERWGFLNNAIMLEETPDRMDRFVSRREYFETMAQSRICLNLPGASACGRALRYYEIPYVGSYMLSQRFPAKLLCPFYDGLHCNLFSSLDELDYHIGTMLEGEVEREKIAVEGHRHAMTNHTVDARMDYLFSELEGR